MNKFTSALLLVLPLAANASGPILSRPLPQARIVETKAAPSSWQEFWSSLAGSLTPYTADLTVVVTDAATGAPLQDAVVLVGSAEGSPFTANKINTDKNGLALFSAGELRNGAALPVTAKRTGYSTLTVAEVQGARVELALTKDPDAANFAFLQGKILGFPAGIGNTSIETGFFVPAISAAALLNFNLQTVLSSYMIDMDIYGKRRIPGNLVFPDQRKSYLLPIVLNKPEFIMPLSKDLNARMSSLVGSLPIGPAIGAMQSYDYLEMMNLTTVTHAVWSERMDVNGDARFDMTVKEPLQQKKIIHEISGIAAKMDVAGVALLAPGGDKQDLIPLDIKSMKPSDIKGGKAVVKLASLAQPRAGDIFYAFSGMLDRKKIDESLLKPGEESTISGALNVIPASGQVTASGFLGLMTGLSASADYREFRFTSPTNAAAALTADFIQLNLYSDTANAYTKGFTRRLVWSVVMPGSASSAKLPLIDSLPVFPAPDASKHEKFSMELIAVRTTANGRALDTHMSIDKLKFVSRTMEFF